MPGYVVNLNSANLDLDALSGWQSSTTTAEQPAVTSAPVIASQVDDRQQNLEALRDFTAQLNLQAAQVTYRGMNVTQLAVTADNQRGLLTLHKLAGQLAGGDFPCRERSTRAAINR